MKTVLFTLMTLMLFSGCAHKGPRTTEHVRAYGYPVPVYHKGPVVENTHRYREKHKKQHKAHPNPGRGMHQKSQLKKSKGIVKKVHPRNNEVEKHSDNSNNKRKTKRKQG